jgi:hypothetical protein
MEELLNKYNIKVYNKNINYVYHNTALGIGDLLLMINLLKYNLIKAPVYINLYYFKDNTYPNPLNALEFRIKLMEYICRINEIDYSNIIYIYDNDLDLNQHKNVLRNLTNVRLKLDWDNISIENINKNQLLNKEYIVFHTKCRFLNGYDYNLLKKRLANFFNNYKSKYTIVLLGEKEFAETYEVRAHGITTIYKELLLLNRNNTIIDLTKDDIYNNLNFDEYLVDMKIINNAKYNICVGCGGQFCNTLFFGNNSIVLWDNILNCYQINNLPNLNMYNNIDMFIQKLNML